MSIENHAPGAEILGGSVDVADVPTAGSKEADHAGEHARAWLPRFLRAALSLGTTAVLLAVVIPRLAGGQWGSIFAAIGAISAWQILALAALWAAGLLAHSTTLAAAMPKLGRRRALILSLTGSSIANILPFGGAAGMALNYRMSRSWGFQPRSIGIYSVITNVWDVLIRLSLPAIALGWLILTGASGASRLIGTAAVATVGLVGFALIAGFIIISETFALRVGALLDRVATRIGTLVHSSRRLDIGGALVRARSDSAELISQVWPRLTAGVISYAILLAGLLWASLRVAGAGVTIPIVLAGLAFERVVTMVPLTPGGAGVVEVGLSGLLIALGGDPVATVAGVLLFRFFTYAIEIPVGGVGVVSWLWSNRSNRRQPIGAEA